MKQNTEVQIQELEELLESEKEKKREFRSKLEDAEELMNNLEQSLEKERSERKKLETSFKQQLASRDEKIRQVESLVQEIETQNKSQKHEEIQLLQNNLQQLQLNLRFGLKICI